MQALFIHGMGRTPLSALPMLARLKSKGLQPSTFGYATAFHDFGTISQRLAGRIQEMADKGDYILIGHSLGGFSGPDNWRAAHTAFVKVLRDEGIDYE